MVKSKGGNMTTVKFQNRALILNLLKKHGAVSRVDIAEMLQLTPAAITILVNEMVKEGIIKEVGQLQEEDKRSGRKKVLIDIDYNYKHVIGINIESDQISIGIANTKGEIKVKKRMTTDKTILPKELLQRIASECMNILWKENILKEDILGVGVGIVGRVDEVLGISKHAYGLWKQEVNVKRILEEALGARVVIDNNVRTLALGEIDYHNKEEMSSVLFIKYGPGIGAAMIINNEIYYGDNNSAGEIGHTVVDMDGDQCRCGRRGCLETIASYEVILRKIASIFGKDKTPRLYELCQENVNNISIDKICNAAEEGDLEVVDIIKRVVSYMALAISNAISLYDPHKVILYGEVFKIDFIMTEFKKVISEIIVSEDIDDFINTSVLSYKSNHVGGVALALREFFYNTGGI